jgi:hypothetical protein
MLGSTWTHSRIRFRFLPPSIISFDCLSSLSLLLLQPDMSSLQHPSLSLLSATLSSSLSTQSLSSKDQILDYKLFQLAESRSRQARHKLGMRERSRWSGTLVLGWGEEEESEEEEEGGIAIGYGRDREWGATMTRLGDGKAGLEAVWSSAVDDRGAAVEEEAQGIEKLLSAMLDRLKINSSTNPSTPLGTGYSTPRHPLPPSISSRRSSTISSFLPNFRLAADSDSDSSDGDAAGSSRRVSLADSTSSLSNDSLMESMPEVIKLRLILAGMVDSLVASDSPNAGDLSASPPSSLLYATQLLSPLSSAPLQRSSVLHEPSQAEVDQVPFPNGLPPTVPDAFTSSSILPPGSIWNHGELY